MDCTKFQIHEKEKIYNWKNLPNFGTNKFYHKTRFIQAENSEFLNETKIQVHELEKF